MNVINKHAKGNRHELEARKQLQEDGWLTEQKNWNRYASKDFFTMFDILAIKGVEVRLIQIKSNPSDFYKARKEIENWMRNNDIYIKCEVWLREDRKPFRKEVINANL